MSIRLYIPKRSHGKIEDDDSSDLAMLMMHALVVIFQSLISAAFMNASAAMNTSIYLSVSECSIQEYIGQSITSVSIHSHLLKASRYD